MRIHFLPAGLSTALALALSAAASAQTPAAQLQWPFAHQQGAAPADALRHVPAELHGKFAYAPGVAGDAVRFDGYTTSMAVPANQVPSPGPDGFTLEAWVALDAYPWNWVPIADQQSQHQAGYLFGIDAFGHLGFSASINGQWRSAISSTTLPLRRWTHVAGIYRVAQGHGVLAVYLDGAKAAELPVDGVFSPSKNDLLIGRVRQPVLPFPEAEVKPPQPIWFSLDGLLDEFSVSSRARTDQEIAQDHASITVPPGDVLPLAQMPSGPSTPAKFGAYYASLKYEDTWDRLRQIGPDSDVLVRFDESPSKLVFWQGLNYVPAWVTGNDKWYTDEFLEVWDKGCPDGGDCEPMSDKFGRFSHVEILESNAVRAVIHWRYALIEAVNDKAAWPDPLTGWSDWADEYWTVYPDGMAVRKQVLHSANTHGVHEWQETIVLHQPGHRPEDDINSDAITLGNLAGVTKTYTWQPNTTGAFADPLGPADVTTPPAANMQLVNLKSEWKPFQIVPPDGVSSDFYNNERSYFQFECWNHWPVAQIASSDRPCITTDRPSHSSLSHLFWKTSSDTEGAATKILLDGLTSKSLPELIPLAKSWLSPPPLEIQSGPYRSDGYDNTQRAYVVTTAHSTTEPLRLILQASEASPVHHAAILVRNWGDRVPRLFVGDRPAPQVKQFRTALVPRLDGIDLLIWLESESTRPLSIEVKGGTN